MAVKIASCVSSSLSSPFQTRRSSKVSLPPESHGCLQFSRKQLKVVKVGPSRSLHGNMNSKERFRNLQFMFFASSDDLISDSGVGVDGAEQENDDLLVEDEPSSIAGDLLVEDEPSEIAESSKGRPGFISFYNRPYERKSEILGPIVPRSRQNNLLWFVGPAVLVASFIFPSLYMRRILSSVFEDSLLTDFLILFFTEALFYCGVAVFLLIIDHLRRPTEFINGKNRGNLAPQLVNRITSVVVLVLSLVIPMVTMGLVWPWTGPAASATLAPYLVGIIVQFAFEQYARYVKSPSWPVIPVIFQVYRLHQLNRAAQLVTALSFTVRGAEMTPHNLAINSSLTTLLNVLQCLGVICIWSLSSFVMRSLPSTTITGQ